MSKKINEKVLAWVGVGVYLLGAAVLASYFDKDDKQPEPAKAPEIKVLNDDFTYTKEYLEYCNKVGNRLNEVLISGEFNKSL